MTKEAMELISLQERGAEYCAAEAARVLSQGGLILYPTDTMYGLGADALSDEALRAVRAVKGREERKPIHAIVENLDVAAAYAEIHELAQRLATRFLPGRLTLVLKKRDGVDSGIGKGAATFGIRIPDHPFCAALARVYGCPYTTTSANRSGLEPKQLVSDIAVQLGEDAAAQVALAVDAGALPESRPSTVVDVSAGEPVILREGAISKEEILAAL